MKACGLLLISGIFVVQAELPKLLLVSFDGFRYDLLNKTMVPNIFDWAQKSAWFVNGTQSQYVTYTAPNHMSMSTGLFEESHGILGNTFFDTSLNELFDYFNFTGKAGIVNASMDSKWYLGEPIWITNEKMGNGRRSAALDWPSGDAFFPQTPHRPQFFRSWTTYGNQSSWMSDADKVVSLFHEGYNFVSWYIAEPDHTLHTNGFFNGALPKTLKQLDATFEYLLKKLETSGLSDNINLILTADHGHAEIIDEKHVMCVPDYINQDDIIYGDHMIYTKNDSHAEEIYKNLTDAVNKYGFKVNIHLKKNVPSEWHYTQGNRSGQVIVEAQIGSAISFHCTKEKLAIDFGESGIKFNSSTHGMDPKNPEMRAFLIMNGPAFASQKIEEIPQNVDLYELMCLLLEVSPAPHNGSLSIMKQALVRQNNSQINFNVVTDNLGFAIFFLPPLCIVLLYFVLGCRHTILKDDPNWARANVSKGYRPLQSNCDPEEGIEALPSTHFRRDESVKMSGLLAQSDSEFEDF